MISYVLPTHDRPDALAGTLAALGRLPPHDANVIIVDNASPTPVSAPRILQNGLQIDLSRPDANIAAAARNQGVTRAIASASSSGHARDDHWIVMLDDDSAPVSLKFLDALREAPGEVAVVAAEVILPPDSQGNTQHEAGGLPEVFIGCGAAVRAKVFQTLGGYDPTFDYYAEEYDFSARVILAGMRVVYDRRFVVQHRKVAAGRDMNRIVRNLARNNAWVAARYAPDSLRASQIRNQLLRYARIAKKERAIRGLMHGLRDLDRTLNDQPRRPMTIEQWRRFTGYAAAHAHLTTLARNESLGRVVIVETGKNVEEINAAAHDAGLHLAHDLTTADTLLVGTLSPGPMLDASARLQTHSHKRIVAPWQLSN